MAADFGHAAKFRLDVVKRIRIPLGDRQFSEFGKVLEIRRDRGEPMDHRVQGGLLVLRLVPQLGVWLSFGR